VPPPTARKQSGAEEYRPDLILLDVMMPRWTGTRCASTSAPTRAADVAIVMLTAKGREVEREKGWPSVRTSTSPSLSRHGSRPQVKEILAAKSGADGAGGDGGRFAGAGPSSLRHLVAGRPAALPGDPRGRTYSSPPERRPCRPRTIHLVLARRDPHLPGLRRLAAALRRWCSPSGAARQRDRDRRGGESRVRDLAAGPHLLAGPAAVHELSAAVASSKRAIADAVAERSGTGEPRERLEAILTALEEGSSCATSGPGCLLNPAARRCSATTRSGIGRSLHLLCAAASIEGALQVLRGARCASRSGGHEGDVSFVCTRLRAPS